MTEKADNTGYVIKHLTDTYSGLEWLMGYFDYIRTNIADGKLDDAAARQQFRDSISKSDIQPIYGKEKLEDTVDWKRVYNKCWEITEPTDDWTKRDLRKRIGRRGIDIDEFGWDLTLTGDKVPDYLTGELAADEQEPQTRAPRKMDEYKPAAKMPGEMNLLELAVEGISTGLRSIELSIKIMSTDDSIREGIELDIKFMRNSLMSLKKILAEQNGEE